MHLWNLVLELSRIELEMTEYKTIKQALREIAQYIHYYNTQRRHSSLGYLTPAQFQDAAA